MKNINQKGFSHLLLLVILVFTLAGAGFAYWRISNSKQNRINDIANIGATNTTNDVDKDPIEKLIEDLRALKPSSLNDQGPNVVVDSYLYEGVEDPKITRGISINSDIYANFESDSRHLKDDFEAVMARNNLTQTSPVSSDASDVITDYEGDNLLCTVMASVHFGRVNCISREHLDAVMSKIPSLTQALDSQKNTVSQELSISYHDLDNESVVGAAVSYKSKAGEHQEQVYFVNTSSEWLLIGENTRDGGSPIQPNCSIFEKQEYKSVFRDVQCSD